MGKWALAIDPILPISVSSFCFFLDRFCFFLYIVGGRGLWRGHRRFDVSRILCPLCIVSFHLFLWRRPYLIFNPVVFPECVCLEAECLRSLFSFSCVPSSNIAGETEWNLGEKQWRSKALCLSVDCCLRDF